MRSPLLLAAFATAALAACNQPDTTDVAAPNVAESRDLGLAGFRTTQPAQARALLPQAKVVPIISVGETIPGLGQPYAPTPDGLGAFDDGGGIVLFGNHELSGSGVSSSNGGPRFRYARVSRLTIDPRTLSVTGGSYPEDGSGLFERLCSATWAGEETGLQPGIFLTGEETLGTVNGSAVLGFDADGAKRTLPHLGAFAHENQIVVPGFDGRVVSLGFDDASGQSELYLYVAPDRAGFVNGSGRLYVFKTDVTSPMGAPLHAGNLTDGQTIPGYFVEVADPADLGAAPTARATRLQAKVDALGAMPFVRIEDGDYVKREEFLEGQAGAGRAGRRPTVYFVDTGSGSVTGRAQVGASCGGVCDLAGSLYKLTLDPSDPTANATLTLVERSKGAASGWASPDNVGISRRSIMLQEDPAYDGFDGSRAPAIFNARLGPNGRVGSFAKVIEATQEQLIPGDAGKCVDAAGRCWETSGIISTEDLLGEGTWLFVVQAHTLPFTSGGFSYPSESGQLLYARIPGT